MESMLMLALVAALAVSPVSLELVVNTNSSDPVPVFSLNIGSIFPFFGPVDFDAQRDREPVDDVIEPISPQSNDSDPSGGIVSIHIMEVFSIRDPNQDSSEEPTNEFGPSSSILLGKIFQDMFASMGLLDLSGRNMTSDEVYAALRARKEEGRPVTTLILSNSRIHPMDAGTFAAAEGSINTLVMSNTSVNLDALRGLTNLKVLNLSNNALSTFPWYGLMADTLEVLDLSNNNFVEVRPELSMLKNLRELYLSNNKIRKVEESPLNMLPNLETLDLTMNRLGKANLASLTNLNRVDVDWNFLRLMGSDCILPPQPLALKLASNMWRCDCGLLNARDTNQVLDLDELMCFKYRNVDNDFVGHETPSFPDHNSPHVASLMEDSIEHEGCKDLPDHSEYLSNEYVKLRDIGSAQLANDILLFTTILLFFMVCVFVSFQICSSSKKVGSGKIWVMDKNVPKWSFEKLNKGQEVPYIKINEKLNKS